MTDYTIPCETVVRFAALLNDKNGPWFNTLRIENGLAIASNRKLIAIENISSPDGIIHLVNDPVLIEQCRKEAPFNSVLTIIVVEALKFATAKTTLGYIHPGNCVLWSDERDADFERWREVVQRATVSTTPQSSGLGMYWNVEQLVALAKSSPSGHITFEEQIDMSRPNIVRDVHDPNWFGLFNPFPDDIDFTPATMPAWFS